MTAALVEVEAPPVDDRISSDAVVALTGVTYRQLTHWADQRHVFPDNYGRGSGVPLLWPPREVEVVRLMRQMRTLGFSLVQAAHLARYPSERTRIAAILFGSTL